MQSLTFSWVTLSVQTYDNAQTYHSAQSEVGLYKYTVLYVGMSDVSHLVGVLFHQPCLHGFYLETLLRLSGIKE